MSDDELTAVGCLIPIAIVLALIATAYLLGTAH